MTEVKINGAALQTAAELHQQLARGLQSPDYYGHNLDALADCLGDMAQPVTITLTHTQALAQTLGLRYVTALEHLLTRAAAENPCLTVCIFPQEEY